MERLHRSSGQRTAKPLTNVEDVLEQGALWEVVRSRSLLEVAEYSDAGREYDGKQWAIPQQLRPKTSPSTECSCETDLEFCSGNETASIPPKGRYPRIVWACTRARE